MWNWHDASFGMNVVAMALGGAVGGVLYGLALGYTRSRLRAGIAMAVSASAGATLAFRLVGYDLYWGFGPLMGISGALAFAVLMWKPLPPDAAMVKD